MSKWKDLGLFLQIIPGMKIGTLIRVLLRNGLRIHWRYLDRLAYLFFAGAYNSILAYLEEVVDGNQIEASQIKEPPIFIIGYWRSGTTHLHNLLSCDETFHCPTAYQASFPHHFVYSQPWGNKIFNFLSPPKRPMDNIPMFATAPHEDEFALAALSTASPYMRALFPITGDQGYSAIDPRRLAPQALEKWKAAMTLFLKKLTFSKDKRLVLKSPPHLGRVRLLLELFPGAKFVHIFRNPYVVYLSAKKVWQDGLSYSHLQVPDPKKIDEIILSWYRELYALFERDRELIPLGSLSEVRFEDLEKAPEANLSRIYADLGLPGFDRFWGRASQYLESIKGYKKNQYFLREEDREKVSRLWHETFERYDYPLLNTLAPDHPLSIG
jgi:hypothetical protein